MSNFTDITSTMNNTQLKYFEWAIDYYDDAPEWVWRNPIVLTSVKAGLAGSMKRANYNNTGNPRGLVDYTVTNNQGESYHFKYKGVKCAIQ